MNQRDIKTIYKKPLEDLEVRMTFDNFKIYQELVEGHIEIVPFPGIKNVLVLLNEEGKIYGMEPNIRVQEYEDVFVGPMVVVGEDGDRFRSLTDDEIEKVSNYIKQHDYKLYLEKLKSDYEK